MKLTLLALAASSLIVTSAPVLAQDAGYPGATGVTGSMTGSNTGSSNTWNRNMGERDYDRPDAGYADGPSYDGDRYMQEGRASAPEYGSRYDDRQDYRSHGPRYGSHRDGYDGPQSDSDDDGDDSSR